MLKNRYAAKTWKFRKHENFIVSGREVVIDPDSAIQYLLGVFSLHLEGTCIKL